MSMLNYAVSLEKQTLIVFVAELSDDKEPFRRYTEARLWQLIVDSWISEGGAPAALRYVAIWQVSNTASKQAILKESSSSKMPEGRLDIIPTESSSAFSDIPFLRSGLRVAQELDRGSEYTVQMKGATLVKLGTDPETTSLHIVMELESNRKEVDQCEKESGQSSVQTEPAVEGPSNNSGKRLPAWAKQGNDSSSGASIPPWAKE